MPFKNMPKECFALWEKVYDASKKKGDSEEKAAKKAYGAIKNAGWAKNAEGQWTKKASLQEFSLRLERASYDKASGEKRWRAVASDIDTDDYGDNMSLELFNDFIGRIEQKSEVPEPFRSEFWKGGLPYLSVSHYPDLDGKAVPGMSDSVYIDGSCFKAKGTFTENPVGEACFRAVCKDLYAEERKSADDKIRISIAFLDYAHKHKSSGFVFERATLDDWCPECLKELITGESEGKEFLKGHLIHLALTRVPVNTRTSMEVDKSMTAKTRKEDAASIVGDEIAEELDNEAKLVGKSEALVVKSDEELEETKTPEEIVPEIVEEAKKPIKEDEEEADPKEEEDTKKKEKKVKKSEVVEPDPLEEVKKELAEIRSTLSAPKPEPHSLDEAFVAFKSAFDEVMKAETPPDERLNAIREPYNQLGQAIVDEINSKVVALPITTAPAPDLAVQLSTAMVEVLKPVMQKMDLLLAQMSATQVAGKVTNQYPARLSIPGTPQMQADIRQQKINPAIKSETPKLRAILERTV